MPTYKTKKGGKIKTVKPISGPAKKLLGMKTVRKKASGGKMATPKSLDKAITEKANRLFDEMGPEKARKAMAKDFANYKRKKGHEHKFDPKHPMNSERTGPSTVKRKASGGKLKMVEKNGKKVPFYAADGVGKMAKGGGVDPNKLMNPTKYKIKSGDTLSQIAKKHGTSVKAIMKANPNIKNANKIRAGAGLVIPGGLKNKTKNPYKGQTSKEITTGKMAPAKPKRKLPAMGTRKPKGTGIFSRLFGSSAKKTNAPSKAKKKPAVPSNDIAAKKGGVMKKKSVKAYKYGGTVRGAGAATKGKRFGRCG